MHHSSPDSEAGSGLRRQKASPRFGSKAACSNKYLASANTVFCVTLAILRQFDSHTEDSMTLAPRREFFAKLALLGGFAALGGAQRVKAQTARSVTTQDITCDNGMPAFLAHPADAGSYPTVILMHERYGLVKHTRDQAIRCARDGYAVLAPNFFFRHPDQVALNAGNSNYDLTDAESVELIKAALAALTRHGSADLKKVVVAGYCQTGRNPLVFAAEVPISAAVVWYGGAMKRDWETNKSRPKPYEAILDALSCPVFAAFGDADHIISLEDVQRFRNFLEAHKKSYEIHIYRGAPHGWLNDTMPGRYRKPQAEAGWAAQQRFLSEVFAGAHDPKRVSWRFESESGTDYDFTKNVRLE
jgi:carboxymethylenebutenolidase